MLPNCPVLNCPGAKLSLCQIVLVPNCPGAFDKNLKYFAFSYLLIICSLHLPELSYDSQIHNVLTCVITLHFSEWIFLLFFFYNLHDSEVGVYDTLRIPPVLESILPET